MAVGDVVRHRLPRIVKEKTEPVGATLKHMRQENAQQFAQAAAQQGVVPRPQQVAVPFQDVQQGVHRLAAVGFLVAQPHVGQRIPRRPTALNVAAVHDVVCVPFEQGKQLLCERQALLVTRGQVVFGQPVNRKSLGIAVFACTHRLAMGVDLPVDAAMLLVPERAGQVGKCVLRHAEVLWAAKTAVGSRVGPQDASADNPRPRHLIVYDQVVGERAGEAAAGIHCVFDPERQDVVQQFVSPPRPATPPAAAGWPDWAGVPPAGDRWHAGCLFCHYSSLFSLSHANTSSTWQKASPVTVSAAP